MDPAAEVVKLPTVQATNETLAETLDEIACLLESQGANPFRVRAYHTGAETIRRLAQPIAELFHEQGLDGLQELPGIGRSLAHSIEHFLCQGRLPLLERLHGENVPEQLLATVADIGPKLAGRIHRELGIENLQELEAAARDGRLAKVPGMGPKRVQAVRESLAGRWHAARAGRSQEAPTGPPPTVPREAEVDRSVPVAELLHIDEEYRRLAKGGHLPRIAPRRYNPTREAWLPVLHTQCGSRHYTALYSNTSRAHEAGTTHDWVVIYRDDHEHDARWTVITSQYGTLRGLRVIRGREEECREHYRQAVSAPLSDGPPEVKHQRYLDFGA